MQLKQIDETSLERFVNYMRVKLEQNVDKPIHWSELTIENLMIKLDEEFHELKGHIATKDKPIEILSECADIANFAMFVAMKYAFDMNPSDLLAKEGCSVDLPEK